MLDLKAIVSEREELMRQRQAEKHPDELRQVGNKFVMRAKYPSRGREIGSILLLQHRGVATAPARPDVFARVNRGIEARKEADFNAKEAEKAVKSNNLERKTQVCRRNI